MEIIFNGIDWVFGTGWDIWCGLFSSLPYGDPYIAIVAAMMVIYMTNKTINPSNQHY